MLSVGMLSAGDEDYYLAVGSGGPARPDEYYTEGGDCPGGWMGGGSPALGLSGRVDPAALRAVLAGVDPRGGGPLFSVAAAARRRRPGLFLTFSAPKGVSLLGALAAPAVAAAVDAAHAGAVADALGYLEDHALFARRGRDGTGRVPAGGFVAAGFVHRTSRAGDPQLHTHVLAANVVQGADGRWSAPDSRSLFGHARTAGFVYQACLRDRLTRSLGVEWGPVRAGMAEPAGIDPAVLRAFSTRRRAIEAALAETGASGPAAAQVAAYRTRTAKDHAVPQPVLVESWRVRAADLGLDARAVASLTGPGRAPALADPAGLADTLTGPGGLTARRATFDRRDVVRAVAEAAGEGTDRARLEATVEAVLADPRVLLHAPLPARPDAPGGPPGEARYTTVEMVETESRLQAAAVARRGCGAGLVSPTERRRVLDARPSLSDEQARAVGRLLGDGDGVAVLVGRAGTGKTFALDAARAGWHAAGLRVVGAAPSARAAAELEAGSGIASTTLARLLLDADRPRADGGGLPPGGVVVVDEAGMAGTRTLDRLLAAAGRDGTKVVLVGDPAQLPEIDAGGGLRALAAALDAPELTVNRRQEEGWERAALDRLRAGRAAAAVALYRDHGRVTLADTALDARVALVADWWEARRSGAQVGMYALRRADVDALNRLARRLQGDAGRLGAGSLTAAGRVFTAGDDVVALRNHRPAGLLNGTRGVVTAVDPAAGTLSVRTAAGVEVGVPAAYLAAGYLDHGYAVTLHKAQGATVDRAFLLGSDRFFREAGYVGMSRGRQSNDLYLVAGPDDDPETHTRRSPAGHDVAVGAVVESLASSRAQRLATSTGVTLAAAGRTLAALDPAQVELVAHRRALLRRAALADPGAHLAVLGPPPPGGLGRLRWAAAAEAVDAYRDRHGVTDPASPLGPAPDPADPGRAEWDRAGRHLAAALVGLDRPDAARVVDARTRDTRDDGPGWSR